MGTNHISGTVEARVAKFRTQIGYIKSQHTYDKSPLKGRGQGHVTHFNFFGPNDISSTTETRVVNYCTGGRLSPSLRMTITSKRGVIRVT